MREPEVVAGGSALGDRFVAMVGRPEGPGWLGAAELFGDALPAAIAAAGPARGTDNPAVAGLLLFEQYAQRLVSPTLAALHRDGAVLDVRLPAVRAQLVDGTLRRLAFARSPVASGEPDHAAVVDGLLDHLGHAADAVHRHTRVGRRLLRGAIANAVAGTLLHMSWPDADRTRYLPAARVFFERAPELAPLVTVDEVETGGERWMYTDRATCCLAFRTTVNQAREQRYCSACPVLPAATTRELFGRATSAYAARFPRG